MGPQSVVVVGLRVIIHPADGAEVEDGVEAGEDLLGCRLERICVHVVRGLPGPVHGLAQRYIYGAFPSEVALTRLGHRGQRVGVCAVNFLANVDSSHFVNQAGTRSVLADYHIELGPVIEDSERALLNGLTLLGTGVILCLAPPPNSVLNRGVKEGSRPIELGRFREIRGWTRAGGKAAQRPANDYEPLATALILLRDEARGR